MDPAADPVGLVHHDGLEVPLVHGQVVGWIGMPDLVQLGLVEGQVDGWEAHPRALELVLHLDEGAGMLEEGLQQLGGELVGALGLGGHGHGGKQRSFRDEGLALLDDGAKLTDCVRRTRDDIEKKAQF